MHVDSRWRYHAARYLFLPLIKIRGVETYNFENLPQADTPYILAFKHMSLLDIPVIGNALYEQDGTEIHFVTKEGLIDSRILGNYIKKAGGIRFDRKRSRNSQPEFTERINYVLSNNGVPGIAPEKHRIKSPHLEITVKGLGMLAVLNNVDIATMGVYGTDKPFGKMILAAGKTVPVGDHVDDERTRRIRMVEMEREYTDSLQEATYEAYERAGVQVG